MDQFVTMSRTLNDLWRKGYVEDFNLRKDMLECGKGSFCSRDFKVDNFYRFEGESDPSDSCILYAISSEQHQIKGVVVNGYGIYSDPWTDNMLQDVMHRPVYDLADK